jgi:hypothetical protein
MSKSPTPKQQAMIDAVKAHAQEHYATGGWDYIIECYEDSDILELINGCNSPENAIRCAGRVMKMKDDYRREIQNA